VLVVPSAVPVVVLVVLTLLTLISGLTGCGSANASPRLMLISGLMGCGSANASPRLMLISGLTVCGSAGSANASTCAKGADNASPRIPKVVSQRFKVKIGVGMMYAV
jgi:hypothetical protein